MNDWTNDSLQKGDLVEYMWETGYMALEGGRLPMNAIVLEANPPPLGSHHVYAVQIMLATGRRTTVPRTSIRKIQ